MGALRLFFALGIFCIVATHASGNKYSKDVNMKHQKNNIPSKKYGDGGVGKERLKEDQPFRTQKVNLIWQKAKKRVADSELEALYVDLRLHDKLEMETKKHRTNNLDKDGAMQAMTRQKLIEVLKKYGLHDELLEGGKQQDSGENEVLKTAAEQRANKMDDMMDQKTKRLWKKAEEAGFSEDELEELRIELSHHQERMDEFQQIRNELDVMMDVSDNSIQGHKKSEHQKFKKEKSVDLKNKHRLMMDKFMELEELTNRKIAGDEDFSEPRVIKLWKYAKEANFTEEELASLKEELAHYQHKLIKHQHFTDEMEERKNVYSSVKKNNVDPSKNTEKIEEKMKDASRKIDKLDNHLSQKIAKQMGLSHAEL